MNKIHRFNEFNKINEEDDFESDFDLDEMEDEVGDDSGNKATSDKDIDKTDPVVYVDNTIKQLEITISNFFEEVSAVSEEEVDGQVINIVDKDQASYYEQGVELVDIKKTNMPLNKTLIVKYIDTEYEYHLYINIPILKDNVKQDGDPSMIDECEVLFKKFQANELLGEIRKYGVKVNNIDQDYIDILNGEVDQKFSIADNFEIEFKED